MPYQPRRTPRAADCILDGISQILNVNYDVMNVLQHRVCAEAERRVGQGRHSVPLRARRWPADVNGVDEVDEHQLGWKTVDFAEQV